MRITVKAHGLEELEKRFSKGSLKRMRERVDKTTEEYARKMANDSAAMAPVLYNVLRPSIAASVRKEKEMHWYYGSPVPYARRWEYEHRSKAGYFRKSVWRNRQAYRQAVRDDVRRLGR